ncbi:MAG: SYNERG-CTERM sorting domain-containing protein [Cloacibacillus sp.]|nr:SYNERG-CTERM sorting domain-containing protein [Cloacibacillus sp.]
MLATKTVEPHHGGSSSGCNAGFAGLLLLVAIPFIYRRKR